jgi:FO synthase subunit 2
MTGSNRSPATASGRFEMTDGVVTDESFEDALAAARAGSRLSVSQGIELMTTGTERPGIDAGRKEQVLEAADRRRAAVVGEEVSFVANLNNNLTTACDTGCLFCNFKDPAHAFESDAPAEHGERGFTKTPGESRAIVAAAVERGIYEVTSVSGLHPALVLDEEHRSLLESMADPPNYKPAARYAVDPGTYVEQISAMNVEGVHVHSMTPEEAYHARRGTDWSYEQVYAKLRDAGLDSVPGTAARRRSEAPSGSRRWRPPRRWGWTSRRRSCTDTSSPNAIASSTSSRSGACRTGPVRSPSSSR